MKQRKIDWEAARAEYETGMSQREVAAKHRVSHTAIQLRCKKEQWKQEDVDASVKRKVAERLAKVVAGGNPVKRAEAIQAEADRVVAVVERHRAEWDSHKALVSEAMETRNFDLARLAKITAETLMIRQGGERKAWGIEKEQNVKESFGEWLESLS